MKKTITYLMGVQISRCMGSEFAVKCLAKGRNGKNWRDYRGMGLFFERREFEISNKL